MPLERQHHPLASRERFARRVALAFGGGIAMVLLSLGIGMLGYHVLEGLSWIDAFANASMILSGMGPLATMHTDAGKVFAGCYALYSGLALISIAGVTFAPIVHRFLHRFHIDPEERER